MKLDTILTFGKYKGWKVKEVIKENPSYILWVHRNVIGWTLSDSMYSNLRAKVLMATVDSYNSSDNTDARNSNSYDNHMWGLH